MLSLLRRLRKLHGWVGLAWMAALPVLAAERFELKDGDRVVFLGDTFFEREGDYGSIEMRLTAAFPDRNVTFRNLAWSGDTPMGRARASFDWGKTEADWLKRVKEQLAIVKPTVAFLSYGMTAGLEGGEAGVPKYITDLGKLMDAVNEVSGAPVRFVLFGPLAHEPVTPGIREQAEANNRALRAVQEATEQLARERGAAFVGFQVPASGKVPEVNDPDLSGSEDGVTPRRATLLKATWVMARSLGLDTSAWGAREAESVLETAVQLKNEPFFHRWRPANWTYLFGFRKHEQGRNAVEIPKFEPLVEEWDGRIAKLRDLKNQDPRVVSEIRGLMEARVARQTRGPAPAASLTPQPVPEFAVHGVRGHAVGGEPDALQADPDELGSAGPALGGQFARLPADPARPGGRGCGGRAGGHGRRRQGGEVDGVRRRAC
jgi:hypothetical protein